MELNAEQFSAQQKTAYVGLTSRVGSHAARPETYDPHGGWAKSFCGTDVSVDHRGEQPVEVEDEYDVSCKKCRRGLKKEGIL